MDKCADEHKFYFLYKTGQIDFQCHAVLNEISESAQTLAGLEVALYKRR